MWIARLPWLCTAIFPSAGSAMCFSSVLLFFRTKNKWALEWLYLATISEIVGAARFWKNLNLLKYLFVNLIFILSYDVGDLISAKGGFTSSDGD